MNMRFLWIACLLTVPVIGGPPLICQRIEIGKAASLPWRSVDGWQGADPSYDRSRLTADTMALLAPETPIAVRMETMRRAAIYAASDPWQAEEIALRLMARVLDGDEAQPMAWFDAGYFVETIRQAGVVYQYNMLSPAEKVNWRVHTGIPGIDGKKWVARAKKLGGTGMDGALARMAD